MNNRINLYILVALLAGCATSQTDVFISHYDFHREGIAPASFRQPWVLAR